MKNVIKIVIVAGALVGLTACGGGGGGTAGEETNSGGTTTGGGTNAGGDTLGGSTNSGGTSGDTNAGGSTAPATFGNNTVGILQFGLIKNGKVEIYKINSTGEVSSKPLFTETTTDGDINHAGRFNTHSSELEDKAYYMYKYTSKEGTDIDANFDGVEDKENIPLGYGSYSLKMQVMTRGEWIKELGGKAFRITPLTHVITSTAYDEDKATAGYKKKLDSLSKQYIQNDIDGDGEIDITDVLVYDPLKNLNDTTPEYRDVIREFPIYLYRKYAAIVAEESKYKKEVGALDVKSDGRMLLKNDKLLILGGDEKLTFVDISDPYDMAIIGDMPADHEHIELISFSESNDKVYAFGKNALKRKLEVIDISDATSPTIIFKEESYQKFLDYEFSTDKKELYFLKSLGAKTYFEIYDLSNEAKPKKISSTVVDKYTDEIYLSKNKNQLYLARIDSNDDDIYYMQSLDISNPKNLKLGSKLVEYKGAFTLFGIGEKDGEFEYGEIITKDKKFAFKYDKNKLGALVKP